MPIPQQLPYWRLLVALWGVMAVVWLALEGSLGRDVLLAGWGLALLAGRLAARRWGGQELPAGRAVALLAALGLAVGAALAPATLLLMALKTGLHAHGPEYTAAELAWLGGQWPLWVVAGGVAGAGLGLLLAARPRR